MNRRQFILAGASSMALGVGARTLAQNTEGGGGTPAHPWTQNTALIDAAAECVKAGEICQEHCFTHLRAGDKSMAKCSETVSTMLPMCRALEELAIQGSPHLKAHAAVCARVCRDCEAACKVHASHHEACKRCMETCQRCAAACEKYAA
jgi:Cys-rich four helix bundle protein (predicted Tat secretion target)